MPIVCPAVGMGQLRWFGDTINFLVLDIYELTVRRVIGWIQKISLKLSCIPAPAAAQTQLSWPITAGSYVTGSPWTASQIRGRLVDLLYSRSYFSV